MFKLIGVFASEPKLFREGVYGSLGFPGRFSRTLSAHDQLIPIWKLSVFDDFDDGLQA